MKPTLLLLLALFLTATLPAQQFQDVRFEGRLNKRKLLLNSTVEYSLTLHNAVGTDLEPPNFRNATVLSGPARAQRSTIINGVASTSLTYTWLLKPTAVGTLTVGPARIRAGSRTLRTNSQTAEVIAPNAAAANEAPEIFLRADLSADSCFLGEQIILDLNLYSTVPISSQNVMNEPDFADFFTQNRRQYDGRPKNVIENGQEYTRRNLGSLALYPTKSGELVITPYDLIVGLIRFQDGGTFSRRRLERLALSTDTLYVNVRELPQPLPDNFSGGVGSYSVSVDADRRVMTVDDAMKLTVTIVGEGDIKRIQSFDPVDPEIFNIYDPRVLQEEQMDSPSGVIGRKVFEYLLIPKRGGEFTLTPTLIYYDIDSSAYVYKVADSIDVKITGEGGPLAFEPDSIEGIQRRLLDVEGDLPAGRRYGLSATDSPLYWILFVLPLLVAGGLIGVRGYREKLDARDPAEVARKRAARVATQRLRTAAEHRKAGNARAFYDAIEGAIMGYLRDKFNLGVSDLSRQQIRERLADAGARSDLTARYDQLLQRCEMALYAGQDGADDLADTYATAQQLFVDTEKQVSINTPGNSTIR